jgi:23S rRNA (cytosine1962-C5)-methyltransferase
MKLQFKRSNDLIFIDKPAGFLSHFSGKGQFGLREIYEKELKTKLFPIHFQDLSATGSTAFATTEARAKELQEVLQTDEATTKYLFLTKGTLAADEMSHRKSIESRAAVTHFRRLKKTQGFELWEAQTETDRPQQVRLHASQVGLAILGDAELGGFPFPHLCLHCEQLEIPGEKPWVTQAPIFMSRLELLQDPTLVHWLSEMDRRQRLYAYQEFPNESLRLIHLPEFRMDVFGSQIWYYWYFDKSPTDSDLSRCGILAELLNKEWLLRKMQNRGEDPNARKIWTSSSWQPSWTALEGGLSYQFHSEMGQSPGLFLDQRANREFLKNNCQGKTVLNLFAYTCGFSVSAGAGSAREICSVDLSGPFLEWGRRNFNLNSLDSSQYEFHQQETLLFLKGALKRGRLFDFIICDPPSFGRHKNGVFRLDQALPEMLKMCWQCLEPGGKMLLSCNLEKWTLPEFREKVQKILPSARMETGLQGWDFELPNEEQLMKSFWITRGK